MAGYSVFAECECGAKQQVPQVGAIPKDWVALRYGELKIGAKGEQPRPELISKIFCSWQCLLKFAQGRLR